MEAPLSPLMPLSRFDAPGSVMKILFVHGALVRDGRWWWSRMVEPLKQHALETSAVELPSCDGKLTDDL